MRTLSTILILIVVLASCQKQSEVPRESRITNERSKYLSKSELRVIDFLGMLDDEGLDKNDLDMDLLDAEWNIEAGLNYLHTELSVTDFDVEWSKVEFEAEKTGDLLSFETVQYLFETLENEVLADLGEGIYSTDVNFKEHESDPNIVVVELNTGKLNTNVNPIFGSVHPYFCSGFGPNHYWSAYNNSFDISPYYAICQGPWQGIDSRMGGADVLRHVLNSCPLRPRDLYTEVEVVNINNQEYDYSGLYVNPNDEVPGDGYLDLYLFDDVQIGTYKCFSPEEMNYYAFEGIPAVIELETPNDNNGNPKRFIGLEDCNYDFGCNQANECVVTLSINIIYAAE